MTAFLEVLFFLFLVCAFVGGIVLSRAERPRGKQPPNPPPPPRAFSEEDR